ncbi:MAG: PH domain-containing protein [Bacillota bacterium]
MGIMGGTRSSNLDKYIKEHLLREETIINNYKFKRNSICVTDIRIIFIDKSLFSRKIEINSIPYTRINNISLIQRRKLFAFSDKIVISTIVNNFEIKISKSEDIYELYKTLIKLTCN